MFDNLRDKVTGALQTLKGEHKLTEENIAQTLKDVRMALLEADVHFKVAKKFVSSVEAKALGEKVLLGIKPQEQLIKIFHDELTTMMGGTVQELKLDRKKSDGPLPLLVVGLNGAGKTTFCGKLALYAKSKKQKNVLLVPADTFRPAAKAQLETLGKQIGVTVFDSDISQDPYQLVEKAYQWAQAQGNYDLVIFDTAGRLHIDNELMDEIVKTKSPLKNHDPEVLLVADAMTGQSAVDVAKTFHDSLQLTGVVLSKMDSDARGGAALSIREMTGVPIRFFSNGEKMSDLELFHPDRLANRILDMGDVVTLVEKAQEAIDEKESQKMLKNLEKNRFTIEDFIGQLDTLGKLGSMESLLKMIPGMGGMMGQIGSLAPAEAEMKKMKILASSMTKAEKENYKLITTNESRKRRIAVGAGHKVEEVNDFLKKFAQMEQMMTGMFSMMKGGGKGLAGMMGGNRPGFRSPPGGASPFGNMGGDGKKKGGGGKGPFGKSYF